MPAVIELAKVFPAHAGMTRTRWWSSVTRASVPRPRGDDPLIELFGEPDGTCSPPTAGPRAWHGYSPERSSPPPSPGRDGSDHRLPAISAACRDAVGNFLLPVRPQDAFSVQRILIARISRIHHENLHLCAIASGHHRGGRCVGSKIAVRGSSDSVHSSGGVRIRTRDLVDLDVAIRSNST